MANTTQASAGCQPQQSQAELPRGRPHSPDSSGHTQSRGRAPRALPECRLLPCLQDMPAGGLCRPPGSLYTCVAAPEAGSQPGAMAAVTAAPLCLCGSAKGLVGESKGDDSLSSSLSCSLPLLFPLVLACSLLLLPLLLFFLFPFLILASNFHSISRCLPLPSALPSSHSLSFSPS